MCMKKGFNFPSDVNPFLSHQVCLGCVVTTFRINFLYIYYGYKLDYFQENIYYVPEKIQGTIKSFGSFLQAYPINRSSFPISRLLVFVLFFCLLKYSKKHENFTIEPCSAKLLLYSLMKPFRCVDHLYIVMGTSENNLAK